MSGQLIPQSEVDRANEDIVSVIRGYVPDLKRSGKNWSACCPFHKEKSPSFTVNEAKGMFWCFGCGAGKGGGDAVGFVMAMNPGMSFRDAVKSILGEITLESSAIRREPVIRATRCDLPGSAENRERSAEIMSRATLIEKHTYLMRNNTAPGHPVPVNGKGILVIPLINNIGETVNVAAILTSGAINYAAEKPSFGATAILDPLGEHDGKTILCVDYAHAWRIWWAQRGNSRVLAALDADNFRWMLLNCSARFTHVGCDPEEADEHADMGRGVIALPLDPYARIDRRQSAA
jgi:phage/plasmid primase-like uncharacterized protein